MLRSDYSPRLSAAFSSDSDESFCGHEGIAFDNRPDDPSGDGGNFRAAMANDTQSHETPDGTDAAQNSDQYRCGTYAYGKRQGVHQPTHTRHGPSLMATYQPIANDDRKREGLARGTFGPMLGAGSDRTRHEGRRPARQGLQTLVPFPLLGQAF